MVSESLKTMEMRPNTDRLIIKDDTYEVVSTVAYLTGVSKDIFVSPNEPLKEEVYKRLEADKRPRLIHNLCLVRSQIIRHLREVSKAFKTGRRYLHSFDFIPSETVHQLEADGIDLTISGVKKIAKPTDYIININYLLSDRLNNCKEFCPMWLNWDYVRDLIIMPNGLTEAGVREALSKYFGHPEQYPYLTYLVLGASVDGNIFASDRTLVKRLYSWHDDHINVGGKTSDASDFVKRQIYDFIKQSGKVVLMVDCENSDPYKLIAALRGLDTAATSKISSIVLFDGDYTTPAWQILEHYTDIPVEYNLDERIKTSKSLVDIKLTARACQEHYANGIDSFIIASSDSDYWGLISSLPDAKFLFMVEHIKFGADMKTALQNSNIFYCKLDVFFDAEADDLRTETMIRTMNGYVTEREPLNIGNLFERALTVNRINMPDDEKKRTLKKYIKALQIDIDDDGNVSFSFKIHKK